MTEDIIKIAKSDYDFRVHVLTKLGAIETRLDGIEADIEQARASRKHIMNKAEAQGRDIARLQVKSGIWGAVAGMITTVAALIMAWCMKVFN